MIIIIVFVLKDIYSFQLVPSLDDSGPTLYVNTLSPATVEYLTPMLGVLHKRTVSLDAHEMSTIPRITAIEMDSRGIVAGKYFIQ